MNPKQSKLCTFRHWLAVGISSAPDVCAHTNSNQCKHWPFSVSFFKKKWRHEVLGEISVHLSVLELMSLVDHQVFNKIFQTRPRALDMTVSRDLAGTVVGGREKPTLSRSSCPL